MVTTSCVAVRLGLLVAADCRRQETARRMTRRGAGAEQVAELLSPATTSESLRARRLVNKLYKLCVGCIGNKSEIERND